ncbi:MAG: exosortase/archaeosortase family protein [Opitutaceae bacterium]
MSAMGLSAENRETNWGPALLCGLAGAAVFQFFGNASFGYIKSSSLFWWWGYQWFNAESETGHGSIILGISLWLLWRNLRKENRSCESHGAYDSIWPAVIAMVVGVVLHAMGFAAQQARLSILALLIFSWGVLRLGGGRRWGAAAMFPLGFLMLAIPLNALDSAGFWLRLWVIKASAGLAHVAGIGVIQNGTQLMAPDGHYSYDVAAACSGVRSLMALLALSLLMGYLNFRTWWRRGVLVLLCFPLIYLGNVARIASIVFVGHWLGQSGGERAHDVMGYGVFVIVLGGLLMAASALHRWRPEAERGRSAEVGEGRSEIGGNLLGSNAAPYLPSPISPLRTSKAWPVAGLIVLLVMGELFFLARLANLPPRGQVGVKLAADGVNPAELPAFLGTEWIGRRTEVSAVEREVLPRDTGYSRKTYVPLSDPAQWVFLSIVLSGRDRSSIHRPELCVVGQGWTIRAATEHRFSGPGKKAKEFPATVLHVQRVVRTPHGAVVVPQLMVYWFVGGDTVEATYWKRLVRDAWNRVFHARADRWAYVLMQTDARDGDDAALGRMQTVLDQTLPTFANDLPVK